MEGGRNYTKTLLSSGEEKNVDIYIYIYWRLVPCQLFLHSEELLHHLLFLALVSLLCLSDISLKNFHKQLCCMRAEIGFKVYRCSTNPPPKKNSNNNVFSFYMCGHPHLIFHPPLNPTPPVLLFKHPNPFKLLPKLFSTPN